MTDPEVLFDKMFNKLRKQMDANIKKQKELQGKYSLLLSQYDALVKRRNENERIS